MQIKYSYNIADQHDTPSSHWH